MKIKWTINIGIILLLSIHGSIADVSYIDLDTKQTAISTSQVESNGNYNRIDNSSIFYSRIIRDDFEIFVSLPEDYHTSIKMYSTVYLLDADWYFNGSSERSYPYSDMENGVGGILDKLTQKGYEDLILVGVGYPGSTNRGRDFWSYMDDFHNFLNNELVGFIEQNYRTNSIRTLVGHSSGGNYVIYEMLQFPHVVFHNYVALSWVFYEDNIQLVNAMDILIERYEGIKFNVTFYLGVGLSEPDRFLTSYDKMRNDLVKMEFTHFKFSNKKYLGLDHGTIVGPGFYDGLAWSYQLQPVSAFQINTTNIRTNEPVKFTFTGHEGTTGSLMYWDFGDGSPISFDHDPIHKFSKQGSFYINSTVVNDHGSHSSVRLINVTSSSTELRLSQIHFVGLLTLGSLGILLILTKKSKIHLI